MFVAVQEWYQTDTYNLYQSDTRGVRYSLVLEDVRSSRQAEESVVIDILEVGPEGRLGPTAQAPPTPPGPSHSCPSPSHSCPSSAHSHLAPPTHAQLLPP